MQNKEPKLVLSAECDIQAAAGESKGRKVTLKAYNGDKMRLAYWYNPVVIELSGIQVPSQIRPILLSHTADVDYILGQTTSISTKNNELIAEGVIIADGENAQKVLKLADAGYKWQVSIGASADRIEKFEAGQKARVNGREFDGPITVVRAARLGEISIVPLGADDTTSAAIAAEMCFDYLKENHMDKEIKATAAEKVETTKPEIQAAAPAVNPVEDYRKAIAAEQKRIADVQKACGTNAEVCAKAVAEGWTPEKAELEVLRASRPQVAGIIVDKTDAGPQVLQAALMLSAKIAPNQIVAECGEKAVDTASKKYGGLGLQQFLLEAAWANGYVERHFPKADMGIKRLLRAAYGHDLNAAYSQMDVSGILSNIANKSLRAGFDNVEQAWRSICSTRPVNDFKTQTAYRMTGAFQFDKIAPNGEIPHADAGEESYTNKADTYAKMFVVGRTDLINDDLGALTAIPRKIGRGGALKLNDVFWTTFCTNSAFFTAARANYFDGAATNLQLSSLKTAHQMFLDMTDADGKPLGAMPKVLLVPSALYVTAAEMMKSAELRDTTANTKQPVANVFNNMFSVVTSAYLGHASYGNSSTAWYLLADPNDMSTIEVVFLNGNETPIIESADADFNTLGIQFRGYFDFGVALNEYRAGVKSKGAA
jgi:hypothetical protein